MQYALYYQTSSVIEFCRCSLGQMSLQVKWGGGPAVERVQKNEQELGCDEKVCVEHLYSYAAIQTQQTPNLQLKPTNAH